MLLQSPESKIIDKSEDIALTLSETRRLSKMVKELMDLARADINKDVINKTKTDLNELVKNVVIPYEEMARMQNKSMIVNANCKTQVNVDSNKIKQLLVILLDNALKYTEENDSIEVDVRNVDEKVFINVKDTGIGISDEAMKHVFERFYREDKARSREKGGTGLGLSIAHTIVKNHGGTIKIVHNKPKGILVIVKL
jgi:two-component system sensor histidine kinase CiaH